MGIPGSVGGAVRMNAGGHGRETREVLRAARVVDLYGDGEVTDRSVRDLGLGYRHSSLAASESRRVGGVRGRPGRAGPLRGAGGRDRDVATGTSARGCQCRFGLPQPGGRLRRPARRRLRAQRPADRWCRGLAAPRELHPGRRRRPGRRRPGADARGPDAWCAPRPACCSNPRSTWSASSPTRSRRSHRRERRCRDDHHRPAGWRRSRLAESADRSENSGSSGSRSCARRAGGGCGSCSASWSRFLCSASRGSWSSRRSSRSPSCPFAGPATDRTAEVLRAAGVPKGDALLFVDTGAVAGRVEQIPWVKTARVSRELPHGLTIVVTERAAIGWARRPVPAGSPAGTVGTIAVLDATGRVVRDEPGPIPGLPEIAGITSVPVPGDALLNSRSDAVARAAAGSVAGPGGRTGAQPG